MTAGDEVGGRTEIVHTQAFNAPEDAGTAEKGKDGQKLVGESH